MNKMLALVGIGLSAVALLLNIVGLAIPAWLMNGTYKMGLWKMCNGDICTDYADLPSEYTTGSLQATRAMEILGALLVTVALVCAILKQFVMKEQPMLPKISGGTAIASGICMILGCIIFASDNDTGADLGAGFALCIVAGILAGVAGILIFIGFKEN